MDKKLSEKFMQALEYLKDKSGFGSKEVKEEVSISEALGLDKDKADALAEKGLFNKDKQVEKPLENTKIAEDLAKSKDSTDSQQMSDAIQGFQQGQKTSDSAREKSDTAMEKVKDSAMSYGSQAINSGRDSFAEALEKLKRSRS